MKNKNKLLSALLAASMLTAGFPSIVASEVSAADPTSEAVSVSTYNGHTYAVFNKGMTWKNAEKYCEKKGGHLVTIGDKKEQEFVSSLIVDKAEKQTYWIGLRNKNEKWEWVDGTPYKYRNWDKTQPSHGKPGYETENYCQIYSHSIDYTEDNWSVTKGKWNDERNNMSSDVYEEYNFKNSGFICEWDTDLTKTTKKKLAVPTDLKVTSTDTSVTITWGKVKNAVKYYVYSYDDKTHELKKIKTVKTNSVTIDGLEKDSQYNFIISAVDKDNNEGNRTTAIATFTSESETNDTFDMLNMKFGISKKSAFKYCGSDKVTKVKCDLDIATECYACETIFFGVNTNVNMYFNKKGQLCALILYIPMTNEYFTENIFLSYLEMVQENDIPYTYEDAVLAFKVNNNEAMSVTYLGQSNCCFMFMLSTKYTDK